MSTLSERFGDKATRGNTNRAHDMSDKSIQSEAHTNDADASRSQLSRLAIGSGRLVAECRQELDTLRGSATFAMSLGAKELFHTNFLGFLLESDDENLGPVQMRLREALGWPRRGDELPNCAVWREKKDLDLVLGALRTQQEEERASRGAGKDEPVDDDKDRLSASAQVVFSRRFHVVEAKLKSIPTWQQLERYDKVLERGFDVEPPDYLLSKSKVKVKAGSGVTKALLSTSSHSVRDTWNPVTWTSVADALRTSISGLSTEFKLKEILEDYAESLVALTSLAAKANELVNEALQENSGATYRALLQECSHREFARLRLQDFMSKLMFDVWLRHLLPSLTAALGEGRVEAGVLYTRTVPGIEFVVALKGSRQLVVQLQGHDYRHCLASTSDDNALESDAASKGPWDAWMYGEALGVPFNGRMGKARSRGRSLELMAFNHKRFVYRRARIEDAATLEAIGEQIEVSLTSALELARLDANRC